MPDLSDDFRGPRLSVQWEWNHAPRAGKWSLSQRPGWLRLHAWTPVRPEFNAVPNLLSQRAWRTADNVVTVLLDTAGMADGQTAGLSHDSRTFAYLGISQADGTRRLVLGAPEGVQPGPELKPGRVWLRSRWGFDGMAQFSYSLDGSRFESLGPAHQLGWGHYRGDRIGLFTFNALGERGVADFSRFRYQIARQTGDIVSTQGAGSPAT